MARRFKLSKRAAGKTFRRGAKIHRKNLRRSPSRGGIRL